MHWPDPAQRQRIAEIRDNLIARIAEAEREGWLGEVEGLQISLAGANDKLAQIDRRSTAPLSTSACPTHNTRKPHGRKVILSSDKPRYPDPGSTTRPTSAPRSNAFEPAEIQPHQTGRSYRIDNAPPTPHSGSG